MKIFILNPEDSFISIRSFHVQYSLMKPILSTHHTQLMKF